MDGESTATAAATTIEARAVDAGRGLTWWSEAWALFTKAVGLWIVLAVILFLIFVVLAVIPLLGGLVAALLVPAFMASWMLAARKLDAGGTLEIGDLFSAFKGEQLTSLLVLGALFLAASVVIAVVAGVLGIGAVMGMVAGGAKQSMGGMMAAMGAGMLALLVGLVLGVLVAMATWFAPTLVVFRGMQPVDALRASFSASLKNMVPFLLFGLIYIVASIVASIPFGLGWIVLGPLVMLTLYVSYKDVFGT